jgi:hypothetical protein
MRTRIFLSIALALTALPVLSSGAQAHLRHRDRTVVAAPADTGGCILTRLLHR